METADQAQLLGPALEEYDLWSEVGVSSSLDIHVAPHQNTSLARLLDTAGVKHSVLIPDLEPLVARARMGPGVGREVVARQGHSMDWTQYHPIEDMHSYLAFLQDTYNFVCLERIGRSYEGQEMVIAKVCKGGCGHKPAMWIDGGIHAREWISPAAVMWLLKELVENHSYHPDLLDNLDW